MQIEFSKTIQHITEDSGTEITPGGDVGRVPRRVPARRRRATCSSATSCTPAPAGRSATAITAQVVVDGEHHTVAGEGSGPISAFVRGLRREFGVAARRRRLRRARHPDGVGGRSAEATAAAYVEIGRPPAILTAPTSPLGHRHRRRHHHGRAEGRARRARAPAALTPTTAAVRPTRTGEHYGDGDAQEQAQARCGRVRPPLVSAGDVAAPGGDGRRRGLRRGHRAATQAVEPAASGFSRRRWWRRRRVACAAADRAAIAGRWARPRPPARGGTGRGGRPRPYRHGRGGRRAGLGRAHRRRRAPTATRSRRTPRR